MREEEFSDQLVRATDGAHVDVDLLVRGGAARGQQALRRRRIATSVAALSTAAVLGAAAIGVPALLVDDRAPVAAEPGTAFAAGPSGTTVEQLEGLRKQPASPDRAISLGPEQIVEMVAETADAEQVGEVLREHPYLVVATKHQRVVHFRLDGTLTTVAISPANKRAGCAQLGQYADDVPAAARKQLPETTPNDCRVVDGLQVLVHDSGGGQVQTRSASAWNHGYLVEVQSYNVAAGKGPGGSEDVPALLPEPRIDQETLIALTTSEAWFA